MGRRLAVTRAPDRRGGFFSLLVGYRGCGCMYVRTTNGSVTNVSASVMSVAGCRRSEVKIMANRPTEAIKSVQRCQGDTGYWHAEEWAIGITHRRSAGWGRWRTSTQAIALDHVVDRAANAVPNQFECRNHARCRDDGPELIL